MARDEEKNRYITLTIPRGSALEQALLVDSAASGRPLAAVALMRLADYYRGASQPGAAPLSPAVTSLPIMSPPAESRSLLASTAAKPATKEQSLATAAPEKPSEEGRDPEYSPQAARANAAAALDNLDFF